MPSGAPPHDLAKVDQPARMRLGRVGRGIDREIAALCGLSFLADVVTGFLPPTLPLNTQSLGMSLAALGMIMVRHLGHPAVAAVIEQ